MKVGIVGANSHVGAELGVVLQDRDDATPVGIVRNRLATRFLEDQGVETRVADVTDADEAADALEGLDVVCIAARVSQQSVFRTPRASLKLNRRIVRTVARQAPDEAAIAFLSSIAAHGNDVYGPVPTGWLYTHEKRVCERTLKATASDRSGPWYGLRIGNVFGPFQVRARSLAAALARRDEARVAADPDRPSNAVHTPTLADVLLRCGRGEPDAGVYTVVNAPRWTWEDLVTRYAPDDVPVTFTGPPKVDGGGLSFTSLVDAVVPRMGRAINLLYYVPDTSVDWALGRYLRSMGGNVATADGGVIEEDMFAFRPAPGPLLEPDEATGDLLDEHGPALEEAFGSAFPAEAILSRAEDPA